MNILFTICGRDGSKGFKNKNLKEMNKVPLVFYTLATIKEYISRHQEDKIVVALNTDSKPLKEVISRQREIAISFIERKETLAGDIVPKVEVIKDTYEQLASCNFDVVIDLDITSPLRRVSDLEGIIEEYAKEEFDIVYSVVPSRRSPYFNMVERKNDGYFKKICQSSYTTRQQAQQCYELNASIYAYNPRFLETKIEHTILDYRCGISVMPDFLVLDIDSEEDFEMMQYLHEYYCSVDAELNEVFILAQNMNRQ